MKIEIVKFYPFKSNIERKNFNGHLRLKFTIKGIEEDFEFEILGMHVIKNGRHWIFQYPNNQGYNDEKKEHVFFPNFLFGKTEHHRQLMDFLFDHGTEYILSLVNDVDNPLVFPAPDKHKVSEQIKVKVKKEEIKIYKDVVNTKVGKARSVSKFKKIK